MEEQQIQDFVHRVAQDENLRNEFVSDADAVIMREGFSPRIARVMKRLVPHLQLTDAEVQIPAGDHWA